MAPNPPVQNEAPLLCSFGLAPSVLKVIPPNRNANIGDCRPMANVGPFGMCRSPHNPAVVAATAATQGAMVPVPCVPVLLGAWMPGDPMNLIQSMPALTRGSKLMCAYAGVVSISG